MPTKSRAIALIYKMDYTNYQKGATYSFPNQLFPFLG